MTESIFVPFVLDTEESCEKAAKVLTSEPKPRVKSNAVFHFLNKQEAENFFNGKGTKKLQETFS